MHQVALRRRVLILALLIGSWPATWWAFSNVSVGEPLPNPTMSALDGGELNLLSGEEASIFVMFRPDQEHSKETLSQLPTLMEELAGKPVGWVGVVSDRYDAALVEELLAETQVEMPILIDRGDALYGELGLRLHPVVGIADQQGQLAAYLHFTKIQFLETLRGHILHTLGEIDEAELAAILEPQKRVIGEQAEVAKRHLRLGQMLLKVGNHERALGEAESAVEANPENSTAYLLMAEAQAGLGDCEAARQALAKAGEEVPEGEPLPPALQACSEAAEG